MKLAVALAVLPAAAAFVGPAAAPAETRLRETKADLEALAKELNPTVGFYDPLGLSSQNFSGYVVQANGFHWPWAMTMDGRSFDVAGSPPEQWDAIPLNAKLQIVAFVGFLEFYSEIAGTHYMKGGVPGKYPSFAETGFDAVMPVDLYDPAGLWGDMSAEKSKRGLAGEIDNGRAAMLGIFGFMVASKVDGSVPALSFIKPYAGDC